MGTHCAGRVFCIGTNALGSGPVQLSIESCAAFTEQGPTPTTPISHRLHDPVLATQWPIARPLATSTYSTILDAAESKVALPPLLLHSYALLIRRPIGQGPVEQMQINNNLFPIILL